MAMSFSDGTEPITTAYIERVNEQHEMLMLATRYVSDTGRSVTTSIKQLLSEILIPNQSGVLLSTVHKVKGLEADRVFLLKQTFGRYRRRPGDDDDEESTVGSLLTYTGGHQTSEEELNIEYVAITRAKEHVIWVDMFDKETEDVYPDKLTNVSLADLHSLRDELERETMRYDKTDPTKAGELLERMITVENEIARKSGAY